MLRAFGAFLSVFWLLSLVVHLNGMIYLFGASALTLFAIDLLVHLLKSPRSLGKRGEPFL